MSIEFIESPHQSTRKSPVIDIIVIHATGASTLSSTVNWFQDPRAQTSAHYVIDKDGKIVQMVSTAKKAWQAGRAKWNGVTNINERSIGIELVNLNNGKDPYPEEQIKSLASLVATLISQFPDISLRNIVGHNHIAPRRKTDPGILFPWVYFGTLLKDELDG